MQGLDSQTVGTRTRLPSPTCGRGPGAVDAAHHRGLGSDVSRILAHPAGAGGAFACCMDDDNRSRTRCGRARHARRREGGGASPPRLVQGTIGLRWRRGGASPCTGTPAVTPVLATDVLRWEQRATVQTRQRLPVSERQLRATKPARARETVADRVLVQERRSGAVQGTKKARNFSSTGDLSRLRRGRRRDARPRRHRKLYRRGVPTDLC